MPKGSIVEELLSLEQVQLARELEGAERQRWIELSTILTGERSKAAEKRRWFRVNVVRHAEILSPVVDPDARVISLSAGGLSLVTTRRLERGSRLSLRVSLPLEIEALVNFDAEVRWVSDEAGAQARHGVQFVDVAPAVVAPFLPLLRRHLHLKVESTLTRYEQYFEALPEAVLCVDGIDVVVAANARARALLRSATLEGTNVLELVDAGSKAAMVEALAGVRRHACQIRCELALRSQAHAPLEAAVAPLAGTGDGKGVIITCRDTIEAVEDES
jgi:PAS domain-containing protein